jgi:hypothetical protein
MGTREINVAICAYAAAATGGSFELQPQDPLIHMEVIESPRGLPHTLTAILGLASPVDTTDNMHTAGVHPAQLVGQGRGTGERLGGRCEDNGAWSYVLRTEHALAP